MQTVLAIMIIIPAGLRAVMWKKLYYMALIAVDGATDQVSISTVSDDSPLYQYIDGAAVMGFSAETVKSILGKMGLKPSIGCIKYNAVVAPSRFR
jgi:hypothetical protein